MRHRQWSFLLVLPVVVLAFFFLVGCASTRATITTTAASPGSGSPALALSAPPPPAVVSSTSAVTASAAVTAAAPAEPPPGSILPPGGILPPAETTPPPPPEFTAIDALKDIHFDFDKYDIRPGDAEVLNASAAWMKDNADYLMLVEGHCDERGTNDYNLALGERRAKATVSYLVAQGVQADRFALISYGRERPLCTERNEECWAKNRRAHLLVKAR